MSKAVRGTREWLHARGWKPGDAPGGLVRVDGVWTDGKPLGDTVVNSPPIRLPKPPNETESRYGDILRVRYQDSEVIFEGLSFKLASGGRYTPDWLIKEGATIIAAWEVKGPRQHASHARSVLAWKSAAQEWPMILWGWAQWKDGTWNETEIQPTTSNP